MTTKSRDDLVVSDSFSVRSEWEVEGIHADWLDFVARRFPDYFYRDYSWSNAWWRAYAEGSKVTIHLIRERDSNSLLGIVPLWIERSSFSGFPVRRLEVLGRGLGREDLLIDSISLERSTATLTNILQGMKWDIARFSNLENPATTRLLRSVASACAFNVEATTSPWHCISTAGLFEEYFKARSKNFRKSCRAAKRRSENLGEISFERYDLEAVSRQKFALARNIAEQSWQYHEGGSHFCRKGRTSMIEALRNPIGELSGRCELWFLKIGQTEVAYFFGAAHAERYEAIELAHLEEYAHCSPGKVLLLHVVEEMFGDPTVDQLVLGSGGGYKSSFTDQTVSVDNLVLFRNSAYGRLAFRFRQSAGYALLKRFGKP